MSFDPKSTDEMRKLAEGFYGPHQIDDHIEAINAYEEACDPRQIIHFADLIDSQAKAIAELRGQVAKFRRLLNPVWMSLVERAMCDAPLADDVAIFHFMGSGASDMSHVRDFRELMGDERQAVTEADLLLQSSNGRGS